MDVLLDLTPLATSSKNTGTGRYIKDLARGILEAPAAQRRGLEVEALVAREDRFEVGSLAWRGTDRPAFASEGAWLMRRRLDMPRAIRRARPRLFHATYHLGTPRGSFVPRVVTCLDLIPIALASAYHPGRVVYPLFLRAMEAVRFREARRAIAISQATADDMTRLLGIAPSKIDVVHLGFDLESFRAPSTDEERERARTIREKHGLEEGAYFVQLGTIDPRRNVDVLLRAFATANLDAELVMIGKPSEAQREKLHELLRDLGGALRVRQLGFVPDDELPAIFAGAIALPYTSTYEGFGNAPVEAMACGCPVIASPVSSVKEVVGDAALLVPPRDADALAHAMRRALREPSLRADLRRAGLARSQRFSLHRMASETLEVYARAL